jgi:hypothetical protein
VLFKKDVRRTSVNGTAKERRNLRVAKLII